MVAHMMAATVCRLEAGAPRRDDAPREKVACTLGLRSRAHGSARTL